MLADVLRPGLLRQLPAAVAFRLPDRSVSAGLWIAMLFAGRRDGSRPTWMSVAGLADGKWLLPGLDRLRTILVPEPLCRGPWCWGLAVTPAR